MVTKYKLAKIQDSAYKVVSSPNKETSICISGYYDIFARTPGTYSVTIYKDDFVKALGVIVCSLPLYTFQSGSVVSISNPSDVYTKLKDAIDAKFGASATATLSCNIIDRARSGTSNTAQYLYSNEAFEIRDFLIAFRSIITFIEDSGSVTIRIESRFTDVSDADMSKLGTIPTPAPGVHYQRIYMGAPGTGKTTEALAFAENTIKAKDEDIIRTTFHPATDYASFVGCYKPETYDDPTTPGKSLIKYEYSAQAFIQAYTLAWSYMNEGSSTPVVLIIEEINRANCAQAFGDIFQLLDRTKASAITPEKSLKDYLEINYPESLDRERKMNLPENLSILATMNTSDQSLFPIDSAFLRRWERRYVKIDYSGKTLPPANPSIDSTKPDESANFILQFGGKSYKWIDFLSQVNQRISELQMDEKKMGNYAMKGTIDSTKFIGGVLSYLWDAVCRDLDIEDDSFFMRNGNDSDKVFKFWDIVDMEKADQESLLQGFMKYLGVSEIPVSTTTTPTSPTPASPSPAPAGPTAASTSTPAPASPSPAPAGPTAASTSTPAPASPNTTGSTV